MIVRFRFIWAQAQFLRKLLSGESGLMVVEVSQPEIGMGVRIIRLQLGRCGKFGDGVGQFTLAGQCHGEVFVGEGKIGLKVDRLRKLGCGLRGFGCV